MSDTTTVDILIDQRVAVLVDGNNIELSLHDLVGKRSAMINFDTLIPKLLNNRSLARLIYFREWRLTRRLSSALAKAARVTFARMRAELTREFPPTANIKKATGQLTDDGEPLALPAPDDKKPADRDDA